MESDKLTSVSTELQQLRAENARLKHALKQAQQGIPNIGMLGMRISGVAFLNPKLTFTDCTDRFNELIGLPDSLKGKTLEHLPPLFHRPEVFVAAQKVANGGAGEEVHIKTEDSEKFYRVAFAPWKNEHSLIGMIMTIRDITHSYLLAKELDTKDNLLSQLTKNLSQLVYVFNVQEWKFEYTNRSMSEFSGYTDDEIARMDFPVDVIHEEDRAKYLEHKQGWKKVAHDEHRTVDFRFHHADGSLRWFREISQCIERDRDGNVLRIAGTNEDQTALHQYYQRVIDQERFVRNLTDVAPMLIYIFDLETRTSTFVSREPVFGIGYTEEEWLTFPNGIYDLCHPDDQARLREDHLSIRHAPDEELRELTYRVLHKEGHYIWLKRFHKPYKRNEQGEVRQVIGVLTDVTEHMQDRNRLMESLEELQAKNKELEQFAYVASHDLLEPVRIVGQYLKLLEQRSANSLDEEANQYLSFAHDYNQRMDRLIRELLEFSRMSNQELHRTTIALDEIMENVLRFLTVQIQESKAEIKQDTPHLVCVDPVLTANMLMNLVSNAIKFVKPGTSPNITVTSREVEGMVEVSVSDQGIGIPEHLQERIFVIFQRLHTRDQYPGHGIGLTTAKRIVERHGGKLSLKSTPEEGTTITVSLPQA